MKQIILSQDEMMKKAKEAFRDFERAMRRKIGSTIDPKSRPILENVFINGYMKGLDDLVQMGKDIEKNAS